MPEKIPIWKRVWEWYKKLPWWGKVLGFVALIGVALLFVAQFWKPSFGTGASPRADAAQNGNIEEATARFALTKKQLEEKLKAKKTAEIMLINQSGTLNKKAVAAREKINNATSIEELDAILKTVR